MLLQLVAFINVLIPYEITLLSNSVDEIDLASIVLIPYEITLLSNFNWEGYKPEGF